jgi:hypothetical protein
MVSAPSNSSARTADVPTHLHMLATYSCPISTFLQAVQDAVVAAGLAERLRPSKQSADHQLPLPSAQQQQLRVTAGTLSSAQSTITFDAPPSDELHDTQAPAASVRGGPSDNSAGVSRDRMSNEVRCQITMWATCLASGTPQLHAQLSD